MSANDPFLHRTAESIRAHSERVQSSFGPLTEVQLNWQPNPEVWSVGLVLDHILVTNRTYFPVLQSMVDGSYQMSFWTRFSPLSGALGRSMIKQLGPDPKKKFKSPPAFRPAASKVSSDILDRYQAVQGQLLTLIEGLKGQPVSKIRIPSPATAFITYSVHDALRVIEGHEARHLQQADRLMTRIEFPD